MHRVFCCTKHLGYENTKAKQNIRKNKDTQIDKKPLRHGTSKKEQSLLPTNLQRDSTNFFPVANPLPQKKKYIYIAIRIRGWQKQAKILHSRS